MKKMKAIQVIKFALHCRRDKSSILHYGENESNIMMLLVKAHHKKDHMMKHIYF